MKDTETYTLNVFFLTLNNIQSDPFQKNETVQFTEINFHFNIQRYNISYILKTISVKQIVSFEKESYFGQIRFFMQTVSNNSLWNPVTCHIDYLFNYYIFFNFSQLTYRPMVIFYSSLYYIYREEWVHNFKYEGMKNTSNVCKPQHN